MAGRSQEKNPGEYYMKNILKTIKPFIVKYEPELLIAMGISGMILSTIWGITATIKGNKKISAKSVVLNRSLTPGEIFKEIWHLYLPVLISTGISIPCIIAGNRITAKRGLALATAYSISEAALQEYQEKTKEIVGEKKEKEIHEAVSKELVGKTHSGAQIFITGDGDSLFYEPLSDRYFNSNWNKILKSANELNARALTDISGKITLSDWFRQLNLEETYISDTMGWCVDQGPKGLVEIAIDSSLTPDNIPCGSIHYINRPMLLK